MDPMTQLDDERPTPAARLFIQGDQPWIEIDLGDGGRTMALPAEFAKDLAECITTAYDDLTAAGN